MESQKKALILVGSAGSGKTTGFHFLLENFSQCQQVVTATTRKPRIGEIDGKDYFFFELSDFLAKKEDDFFYETEQIHDNWYGTPKLSVDSLFEQHRIPIFPIDIFGAIFFTELLRKLNVSVTIIYISARQEILEQRLLERGETQESIQKRMTRITLEEEKMKEYEQEILILENNRTKEEFLEKLYHVVRKVI